MDLKRFFQENDIILKNDVFQFRNRKKGTQKTPQNLPAHAPGIIKDLKKIFILFHKNRISITSVDKPVLVAIIQQELGYTKTWSYTIASCIDFILTTTLYEHKTLKSKTVTPNKNIPLYQTTQ